MRETAKAPMTMPAPIRILLVDDHRSVLWGLQRLIDGEKPAMEVAGAVTTPQEAIELLKSKPVDVVLLDLDLGGQSGIDAIARFTAVSQARILILTGMRDPTLHDRAVLAGACGVVGKEDTAETILKALLKAASGEIWLDRAATGRIFVELSRRQSTDAQPDPAQARIASLTPRERQIVAALASDSSASSKVIAARLFISEHTLRNHLTSIYDKLGVTSRLELWAFASKHGLAAQHPLE